jgi:hypothetical protein
MLIVAVLGTAACVTAASASGTAQANGKWTTVPWLSNLETVPLVLGSAAGRGWIGLDHGDGRVAIASVRAVGGKLSLAKAPMLRATGTPGQIVGSDLYYHQPSDVGPELHSVPLLENGMLGSPAAVAGNAEKVPPERFHPRLLAGIHVGDRTVWVLDGGAGFKRYMWACCTSAGGLADLTPLVHQGPGIYSVRLGVDAGGRLWLAWLEIGSSAVRPVRLVELDPTTLAPRTPHASTVPGVRTASRFSLICAAVCRVVVGRLVDIVSWSPGERSPTRLVSGTRAQPRNLIVASYPSAGVTVAYSSALPYNRKRGQVTAIKVVRGDGRGAHMRRLGSADIPTVINPTGLYNQANFGTFTADGLVFFATYYGGGTRVLAGLVPVAR